MYEQTFEEDEDYKMANDMINVERVDATPNSNVGKQVHKVVMNKPHREFSAGTIKVGNSTEVEKGLVNNTAPFQMQL